MLGLSAEGTVLLFSYAPGRNVYHHGLLFALNGVNDLITNLQLANIIIINKRSTPSLKVFSPSAATLSAGGF